MSASTVRWFSSAMPGVQELEEGGYNVNQILKACLIDGFNEQSVTSIEVDGSGVATVTFGVAHGFLEHSWVRISGADQSALNDDWQVYDVTELTLKFQTELGVTTATGTMLARFATPSAGTDRGWELLEEEGTKIAIAPKLPVEMTRSVCIVDTTAVGYNGASGIRYARGCQMYGSGDFTSLAVHGEIFGNSLQHGLIPCFAVANAGARPWLLFADEKFWYLSVSAEGASPNSYGLDLSLIQNWAGFGFPVKESGLEEYGCMTIGPGARYTVVSTNSTLNWDRYSRSGAFGLLRDQTLGGCMKLRRSQDTLTQDRDAFLDAAGGELGMGPITAGEEIFIGKAFVYEGVTNNYRGRLPGILNPLNQMVFTHGEVRTAPVDGSDRKVMFATRAARSGDSAHRSATITGRIGVDITGPWR